MNFYNKFIERRKDYFDIVAYLLSLYKIRSYKNCTSINELLDVTKSYVGHGYYRSLTMHQKDYEIITLCERLQKLDPHNIIEIGTFNGGTFFLWAKLFKIKNLLSIDLPRGQFGGGYNNKKIKFFNSMKNNPNSKFYYIQNDSHKKSTLDETYKIFKDIKVDFLFIDGDHTYDGVKKDYEMYSPLVRSGGVVAFHDIVEHPTKKFLVDKLWNEIKYKYNYSEIIESKDQSSMGIGIIEIN